jgi:hypothetical protein
MVKKTKKNSVPEKIIFLILLKFEYNVMCHYAKSITNSLLEKICSKNNNTVTEKIKPNMLRTLIYLFYLK